MLFKPNWDQALARWQAFWAGDLLDRPPVIAQIVPTRECDVGTPPSLEDTLAWYDPARNGPLLAQAEQGLAERAQLEDDTPPGLTAGGGVYFVGAVFGSPITVTADMMDTEPILNDWRQLDTLRYDPQNTWAQRALKLARQLVARGAGRYAVIPGLLEGPSDICGALRDITRLAGDLYEYPAQVRRLTEIAMDAWISYANAMLDSVPRYDGGTVTQWSLWAPGRAAALQEDFCTLLSPRQYREWFLPLDRELARTVDVMWVHVHAGETHIVDELLTADEFRGIQIVNDGAASPPLARVLPIMQRVQQRGKCLIVRKYPPEDLEQILPHLSPRRLAIDTYCGTVKEARAWLRRLEAWPFNRP